MDGDQEPGYVVCDDIKMPIWSYKEILGAQEHFNITDKYMAKTQINWGKPCIWLCNEDPTTWTGVDLDWIRGNSVIVHLTNTLWEALLVPPPAPVREFNPRVGAWTLPGEEVNKGARSTIEEDHEEFLGRIADMIDGTTFSQPQLPREVTYLENLYGGRTQMNQAMNRYRK